MSSGTCPGQTVPALIRLALLVTTRARVLARLMNIAVFRRLLGAAGRRAAFVRLGADIAPDVVISHSVFIRTPRNVSIGAGTLVNGRVRIESWGKVTIGRHCMFNDDVLVLTAQHDIDSLDFVGDVRPIVIGDYVWLPHRIILLPGVQIGDAAVVGSGSVVTRDVPPYAVVAGNPARIIRERAHLPFRYVPTEL